LVCLFSWDVDLIGESAGNRFASVPILGPDNTLVENGVFPSPVKQVRYILRLNMPFPEYIVKFEEAFMLKKFNDLFESFENVSKVFDVEPDKYNLDRLVAMWNKNKLFSTGYFDLGAAGQ